jgi:type I restriction enzyme S subunit
MKEGWTYKKLGDIATEMFRGSGIKRDQITIEGTPCVRYGEIYTTYNISFSECFSHTNVEFISSPKYFSHGDLLFAITGESVEDIGKTIAYLGHERCLLGGDIVCMKHNQNPKYLSYALSSSEAIRQKGIGKTKLKVVHTNIPALSEIRIPIPSLSEQQRIVSRLDAAFSHIDEMKANAEKQLSEARALFQKSLAKAMEPKEGWGERKFKDLCSFVRGPFGGSLKKEMFVVSGYAVYEQQNAIYNRFNFRYFIDEEKYNSMIRFSVSPGDLIMSCSGTIGKVAIIPDDAAQGIINQALLKLTPKKILDKYYLKYLMESSFFGDLISQYSDGAAIKNIASVAILKDIVLPLPSLSEQQRIVERLDALSAHVRELEENQKKIISECDALKQALLRKVFE